MLQTPYLAECRVGGKTYENVEVRKLNKHTCWINFKPKQSVYDKAVSVITGDNREEIPIKRHLRKHNVHLSYIDVTR